MNHFSLSHTLSDEEARFLLEKIFFSHHPTCPRCQSKAYRIPSRQIYQCSCCRKQFSLKKGYIPVSGYTIREQVVALYFFQGYSMVAMALYLFHLLQGYIPVSDSTPW